MNKIFNASEGYEVKDLLQYGLDHCGAGLKLIEDNNPSFFDSAAYLFHLGIELIFKALHLYNFNQFENTHNIRKLLKQLKTAPYTIQLTPKEIDFLAVIDEYSKIRYPNTSSSINIGTYDFKQAHILISNIINDLPTPLKEIMENIDPTKKGKRALMRKNK